MTEQPTNKTTGPKQPKQTNQQMNQTNQKTTQQTLVKNHDHHDFYRFFSGVKRYNPKLIIPSCLYILQNKCKMISFTISCSPNHNHNYYRDGPQQLAEHLTNF